ncbi:hypothetical protein GN244_ATG06913 [Phytophthora infestans]|uniref:Uncharacterized protein n=1 Tax=Phytophthora infestans TaxID=4787 RepID=A0A833THB8_PHYIN|nr:hypothetical protein GN244_ATG06913 [Phytophthora infestans]KAF4136042.1 hypothetical protein GN958_ATG14788 [Phytophthora infestans]
MRDKNVGRVLGSGEKRGVDQQYAVKFKPLVVDIIHWIIDCVVGFLDASALLRSWRCFVRHLGTDEGSWNAIGEAFWRSIRREREYVNAFKGCSLLSGGRDEGTSSILTYSTRVDFVLGKRVARAEGGKGSRDHLVGVDLTKRWVS